MNESAMTAADVMNPSPRTCSRFSRVIEAVLIFKDEDCGMVPVIEEGKPIGVVTDRDVSLALAGLPDLLNRPVEEIMSRGQISVQVDTPMPEVLATFERELVRRLLVLDAQGLLVGVISWKDMATEANAREVGEVVHEIVDSPTTA